MRIDTLTDAREFVYAWTKDASRGRAWRAIAHAADDHERIAGSYESSGHLDSAKRHRAIANYLRKTARRLEPVDACECGSDGHECKRSITLRLER